MDILMIVVVGIFTVPFFFLGLHKVIIWLYLNQLKKSGYVKVGLMKENFQIYDKWVKPTDNEFKLKLGNEERKFEFSNNLGDCLQNGRELFAIFDETTGKQFKFRNEIDDSDDMSSRDVNTVCDRVFNLGFIMGRKQTEQGVILMWLTLAAVVFLGIFLFLKFGNLEAGLKIMADKLGTTLPVLR